MFCIEQYKMKEALSRMKNMASARVHEHLINAVVKDLFLIPVNAANKDTIQRK